MANGFATMANEGVGAPELPVRRIDVEDLKDALRKGWNDFREMPTHAIFLIVIYPVVGLLLAIATIGGEWLPLLFPLASGFALLGPFAGLGLYELSRLREQGKTLTWRHAFGVLKSHSLLSIVALGFVLLAIFALWLLAAQTIYEATIAQRPITVGELVRQTLTTPAGWTMIVVGNLVGLMFAIVAMAISVVSFPLLLDRNVGLAAAVRTSLRAVAASPRTMAIWGVIVAAALALGSLPLFIGLAIVIPVLGHATWHLYRKTVAR